jgi:hypothetical protein
MENNIIIIKDLLPKTVWPEIWNALLTHYSQFFQDPYNKRAYQKSEVEAAYKDIFTKLHDIVGIPSDLVLIIKKIEYKEGQFGFDPAAYNEECPEGYSMKASPWGNWLGLTISPETLEQFSYAEILAHCLYEMTWFGGSEEEVEETCDYIKGIAGPSEDEIEQLLQENPDEEIFKEKFDPLMEEHGFTDLDEN